MQFLAYKSFRFMCQRVPHGQWWAAKQGASCSPPPTNIFLGASCLALYEPYASSMNNLMGTEIHRGLKYMGTEIHAQQKRVRIFFFPSFQNNTSASFCVCVCVCLKPIAKSFYWLLQSFLYFETVGIIIL